MPQTILTVREDSVGVYIAVLLYANPDQGVLDVEKAAGTGKFRGKGRDH